MKVILSVVAMLLWAQGLLANQTINVSLAHFPPLADTDGKKPQGYFPELFSKILGGTDLKVNYEAIPIARYNHMFGEGIIEIGFWPWGFKSQNHRNLGYAGDVEYGILSPKKGLDIAKEKGCVANNTPIHLPKAQLVKNHSWDGCLEMLRLGRVGYVLILKPLIVDPSLNLKKKYQYEPLGSLTLSLFVHNKHKDHFPAIQKSLGNINLKAFNMKYGLDYKPR